MNLSGVLVTTHRTHLAQVVVALRSVPGVQVAQWDAASGRIVTLLEAEDVAAEVEAFTRLRMLPHVLAADLVCHCFDEDNADATPTPRAQPGAAAAPASLCSRKSP